MQRARAPARGKVNRHGNQALLLASCGFAPRCSYRAHLTNHNKNNRLLAVYYRTDTINDAIRACHYHVLCKGLQWGV